MTISLPIVPDKIAAGATVAINFDTAVNPSESGINGRKSLRDQAIRNFTLTLGPDDVAEIKAIVLAVRGNRWPLCIRDYSDYKLVDEQQTWTASTDGGSINLSKAYTPATGSSNAGGYGGTYSQRILMIDQRDEAFSVKVNGSPVTSGNWSFTGNGIIDVVGLTSGDVVTVTGQYLVPVCFTDDGLNVTLQAVGTSSNVAFVTDLHLKEILEQELTNLTT